MPLASEFGRVPEWPKGADCKSASSAFGGSNPPPSTTKKAHLCWCAFFWRATCRYSTSLSKCVLFYVVIFSPVNTSLLSIIICRRRSRWRSHQGSVATAHPPRPPPRRRRTTILHSTYNHSVFVFLLLLSRITPLYVSLAP